MRVKDAPYGVPPLGTSIEGRFSSTSRWHCMLCSIWHRWNLSCRVYCSISIHPIKSKDHSRILGSRRFLSSYCVVLRGHMSCFGLQEPSWSSAVRQWDTFTLAATSFYTVKKYYLNQASATTALPSESGKHHFLQSESGGKEASHLSTGVM